MERADADVHVTHDDLQDEFLKGFGAIFVFLSQDQVTYLRQVQVQILMRLRIELVDQVFNHTRPVLVT